MGGIEPARRLEGSEVSLEFDIAATPRTQQVMAERELRADARSIGRLLNPRSVAVIGASADPAKLGHVVLTNLLRAGFTGPIFICRGSKLAAGQAVGTLEALPVNV